MSRFDEPSSHELEAEVEVRDLVRQGLSKQELDKLIRHLDEVGQAVEVVLARARWARDGRCDGPNADHAATLDYAAGKLRLASGLAWRGASHES